MLLAVSEALLKHRAAEEAMFENPDPTFRLTTALLALSEQIFFQAALQYLGVSRTDSIEDIVLL